MSHGIRTTPFGKTKSGQAVDLFVLRNDNGMEVSVTNYGGIVTRIDVPDGNGKLTNIALGLKTLDEYLAGHPYFGAIIGRCGNRIADGTFTLAGKKYTLAKNVDGNHLHGGIQGFDKVVWQAQPLPGKEPALKLSYLSKDGEEGYPGNLKILVTYTLTSKNELRIDYQASSDQATPINLTHHSYFNLAGEGAGEILDHIITIHADRFTPVNDKLLPTGEIAAVAGTPFDLRQPVAIGSRIKQDDEQLKRGKGFDHNFVLNRKGKDLELAATVREPRSGRVMDVYTTEPGIQFYTGNFLDGSTTGPTGKKYEYRHGFCLETQHFPDSPNQPSFPSTILEPGTTYRSTTVYAFHNKPN